MKTQITIKKKKLSFKKDDGAETPAAEAGATPPAAEGGEAAPAAPAGPPAVEGPGIVAQIGKGAPTLLSQRPDQMVDEAPPVKLTLYGIFSLLTFIVFLVLVILQYIEWDYYMNQPDPAFPPNP